VSQAIRRFDCTDAAQRSAGIEEAAAAVGRGELVVLPTDTVYGIGADAFMPAAVTAMLNAKGRGRHMPSPVLVGSVRAAAAVIEDLGMHGQDLIDEFWPGALTLVCHAGRTLSWDLGDAKGTVAIRMPLHPVALELLKRTGPMAVSSANRSGASAATTVAEAEAQLGDRVSVYLDGGLRTGGVPSSIVDLTGTVPRLLRAGAISPERLRTVAPIIDGTDSPDSADDTANGADGSADGAGGGPHSTEITRDDSGPPDGVSSHA
jgi:L-threonylcarbamoyladenylate synthase